MKQVYKMRAVLDDAFEWSAINVRGLVDQNTWCEMRSHFSELRGILDEVAVRAEKEAPNIDNLFDSFDANSKQ